MGHVSLSLDRQPISTMQGWQQRNGAPRTARGDNDVDVVREQTGFAPDHRTVLGIQRQIGRRHRDTGRIRRLHSDIMEREVDSARATVPEGPSDVDLRMAERGLRQLHAGNRQFVQSVHAHHHLILHAQQATHATNRSAVGSVRDLSDLSGV
jgi:hypothetical protein